MSFPQYTSYRSSRVEWLGDVPRHWQTVAIKRLSPVLRGASPRPIDDPKYFDENGEFHWVRIADVSAASGVLTNTPQRLSELGSSLSVKILPGDLFVSIAGSVGKPCISGVKACIHDGFVYFPRLNISAKFLYRVFEAGGCYAGLGKLGTQLNLNTETIGSIVIALPPPDEIAAIDTFLDRETAKIDALVEEQRRLIELLKEKRQTVISHAVTKGLDPSAPMKDSGVEWLGEVPAHWEVKAMKRAVVLQRGHDLSTEIRGNGTVPVVSSGGVSGFHDQAITEGPTIVTGRYGTIGEFTFIEEPCWPLNTALYSVDMHGNEPRFVWYMLQSCKQHFILNSLKAAVPGVDRNDIHPTKIAMPPLNEQRDVAAFLGRITQKIDALVAQANAGVALLQERRAALISAAVTGQIDVRGLVPAEAEAA